MSRHKAGQKPPRQKSNSRQPEELLTIEKLIAGGSGFARRASGEPVFVRGGLPGDTITLTSWEARKGYALAKTWSLVSPSPERRPPPCRYAGTCGGCDLMALAPRAQRRTKQELFAEILRRTANLEVGTPMAPPVVWDDPADGRDQLNYRTRVRLHIDTQGQLGFMAERSHVVVAVEQCLVASNAVNHLLAALAELARQRPELLSAFAEVEVRALGEVPDLTWTVRQTPGKPRHKASELSERLELIARHLHGTLASTPPHLVLADEAPARWREFVQSVELTREASSGSVDLQSNSAARLWFAPGSFTQVNWSVNQRIVSDVMLGASRRDAKTFLDLYCGAGNFSLPLLSMGLHGLGVESNPTSIATASTASARQQLGGEFLASDVQRAVEQLVSEGRRFDLVLLDPPRAGFRDVVPALVKMAPKHLFICACDPVTFARDLKLLTAEGFVVDELKAYDMFPQTHHFECSAWLVLPR